MSGLTRCPVASLGAAVAGSLALSVTAQDPPLQPVLIDRAEAVVRFYHDRKLEVMTKEDQSPVTVADVETEKKIKEIILGAFPEHGFYGEETGRSNNDSPFTWLIDPIDGTKSFIRDYPFFSTQIALMHENEIIVGVSNGMMFGELAWAAKGQGAYLNDEAIRCSDIESLGEASLSTGNIKTLATNLAAWQGLATLSTQVNRTRGYGDFYHYHRLAVTIEALTTV